MSEEPEENIIDAEAEGLLSDVEEKALTPGNQIEDYELPGDPLFERIMANGLDAAQNLPPSSARYEASEEPEDGFSLFTRSLPSDTSTATIVVTRYPDHLAALPKLRTPCKDRTPYTSLPWNDQSREEIVTRIRNEFGGGYYHFQMRVAGKMTEYKWYESIYDPASATVQEQTILELAEARSAVVGGGEKRTEPITQPSQPIAPAEKPKSRGEVLTEFAEEYEALARIFGPKEQPPVPVEARVPLKERIAEQVLGSILTEAEGGDSRAKGIIADIAKDALGLNKADEPVAETIYGAVAALISDPTKLDAWMDTGEKAIERFGSAIATHMVKKEEKKQPATPLTPRGPNRFKKQPAPANDAPTAPAPTQEAITSAPEPESMPAASETPKERPRTVKW